MWPFTERKPYINVWRIIEPKCLETQAELNRRVADAHKLREGMTSDEPAVAKLKLEQMKQVEVRAAEDVAFIKGMTEAARLIDAAM